MELEGAVRQSVTSLFRTGRVSIPARERPSLPAADTLQQSSTTGHGNEKEFAMIAHGGSIVREYTSLPYKRAKSLLPNNDILRKIRFATGLLVDEEIPDVILHHRLTNLEKEDRYCFSGSVN